MAVDPCARTAGLVPDDAVSPLKTYAQDFSAWMKDFPYQVPIALCALAVGLFTAWDGLNSWRRIFTVGSMVAAACLARYEATVWDLDIVSELMLMSQAGFSMLLATSVGFDGFQVLFGASLGFITAYSSGDWARRAGGVVPSLPFFWYAAGTVLGMLVVSIWRRPVLATTAPLFGSLLAVSGAGCFLSRAFDAGHLPFLPPTQLSWLEAVSALLEPAGPGALAAHGGCALLAAVIHGGNHERRIPAIGCLVGCSTASSLLAATGLGFGPEEMDSRIWAAFGCLFWVPLAAGAAWRQLSLLPTQEGVDVSRDLAASFQSLGSLRGPPGATLTERGSRFFQALRTQPSRGPGRSYDELAQRPLTKPDVPDEPGKYVITHTPTYVSPSVAVPKYDGDVTDELAAGTVVQVLEIRHSEARVRGRIARPPGWISLLNTASGLRFAAPQD